MYTGDTGALSATVLYSDNSVGDDVRWVSSNRAAVLIDEEGRLTAVAKGESVITAQASNRKSAERAECIVTVADPLRGYALSVRRTALDNYVYIDIQPHDTGVMEIKIYAKSPSGEIYSPTINENNLYHFYTETGSWTVYASLTGENGIYEAHRPEDFVQIEIEDVSAGYVDALLAGLPV